MFAVSVFVRAYKGNYSMCVYVYVYTHDVLVGRVRGCAYIFKYMRGCVRGFVRGCVCVCVCTHVCVCVCACVCVCVCVCKMWVFGCAYIDAGNVFFVPQLCILLFCVDKHVYVHIL